MSTVCAVSTPPGTGGISVIRISGENAFFITDRVFKGVGGKTPLTMDGYTCAFGKIYDGDKAIDDVLLTVFRAPKSYTGEDTAEISCHGGGYVTKRILSLLIKNGAQPAGPGEFTKRAFLNGKLSLTEAEGVMDIISSEGERALRSANNMRSGAVFKKISAVKSRLTDVLSGLAAWVDYPEEDIPAVTADEIKTALHESVSALDKLIKSYDDGIVFKEGVKTALVGSPNVGKSSLMNMLLGFDRSIVTDIPGTTRDVIEETARLGDITLRLNDTAGLRNTDDKVESEGVLRAKQKLSDARLVLAVFDSARELSNDDWELLSELNKENTVVVLNKSDMEKCVDEADFSGFVTVSVSAKNGEGKDALKDEILSVIGADTSGFDEEVFASERQKNCAESAKASLELALFAAESGETQDAVTVAMQRALEHLCELTGESAADSVVSGVFSRFCVGK